MTPRGAPDSTIATPIAAEASPVIPRNPIRSPSKIHERGATTSGWTLMNIDARPAWLWLVPQWNAPIWATVSPVCIASSRPNRGEGHSGWPNHRQAIATTGRANRNRKPATPIGGRSGVANLMATALAPQRAQQPTIRATPGASRGRGPGSVIGGPGRRAGVVIAGGGRGR